MENGNEGKKGKEKRNEGKNRKCLGEIIGEQGRGKLEIRIGRGK
jgi:hypothetical protein